jgi:hypothetical protein
MWFFKGERLIGLIEKIEPIEQLCKLRARNLSV